MIAVHSVSDAFSGAECARLLDLVAEAPARDAGLDQVEFRLGHAEAMPIETPIADPPHKVQEL